MFFTQEDYKKIENWLKERAVKDTDFNYAGGINGEEYVVIVQNGKNKKVSIKDILNIIEIDSSLNENSENPIQNKVVATAIKEIRGALESKVDKVIGKQLSTEDFTTAFKRKLESLNNYDDTKISEDIEKLKSDLNTLLNGDVTEAIESFNEIINFLKSIEDSTTLEGIIAALQAEIALKQDELTKDDFATINGQSVFEKTNIVVDNYESTITDDSLEVTEDYGDIKKGTKLSELKGKSYDQLFDAILFPTINPIITNPSASLAFQNYSNIQEIGSAGPTDSNFKKTFNRGNITLNGEFQNYTAGTIIESQSFVYADNDESKKTFDVVKEGTTIFKYKVSYNEGSQPLNNKGGLYGTPLAAGSVVSSSLELVGVYPWFATTNGATDNTTIKQTLKKNNTTSNEFTLLATATCSQIIETPIAISNIYIKDSVSGNFIESTLNAYILTEVTKNINGNTVTYYRYTYDSNTYGGRGEITLKIKF